MRRLLGYDVDDLQSKKWAKQRSLTQEPVSVRVLWARPRRLPVGAAGAACAQRGLRLRPALGAGEGRLPAGWYRGGPTAAAASAHSRWHRDALSMCMLSEPSKMSPPSEYFIAYSKTINPTFALQTPSPDRDDWSDVVAVAPRRSRPPGTIQRTLFLVFR